MLRGSDSFTAMLLCSAQSGHRVRVFSCNPNSLRGEMVLLQSSAECRPQAYRGSRTTCACLDLRMVLMLQRWEDAILHPPCVHQMPADTVALPFKQKDGRAFWGIAFFIYCWCVDAQRVLVEQPPTIIPDFYLHPTQQVRALDLGDDDSKPFHFFERGRLPLVAAAVPGTDRDPRKRLRDFPDSEARDRWRSSWARLPRLSRAIFEAGNGECVGSPPLYLEEVERFAAAWHNAGLPVPSDYLSPDAQPQSQDARSYQFQRGKGDGRRVQRVVPISCQSSATELSTSELTGMLIPQQCGHPLHLALASNRA